MKWELVLLAAVLLFLGWVGLIAHFVSLLINLVIEILVDIAMLVILGGSWIVKRWWRWMCTPCR